MEPGDSKYETPGSLLLIFIPNLFGGACIHHA